jgi:ubiquinone/menaquinone biosynthesis C-methylase UbiE
MTGEAPDYGLDAPGVVRNLLIAGAAGLLLFASKALGLWKAVVTFTVGGVIVRFPLAPMGLFGGAACLGMALWMIWTSKVGKIQEREKLLDRIAWKGNEHVLDVGCGRGLMLVGAAKRLTNGTATGVDIWQAEDLSGNTPDAPLENARREGVSERVAVKTADMRSLPFPDGTFDVVVSCAAIHNLYVREDRAKAVREISRVLKPGGRAVIDDIRNGREYAAGFAANGCRKVENTGPPFEALLLALMTMGSLRPATILVTK